MKKYCIVVMLLGCSCNVLAGMGNVSLTILNERPTKDPVHRLLVTLIGTCNVDTKKVFIYNLRTYDAIAEIRPQISVLVYTKRSEWKQTMQNQFQEFKIDTIVIVLSQKTVDGFTDDLFLKWPNNRDCIVYIFPLPARDCESYKNFLELIMRFYFVKAYFVCRMNDGLTRVYTHDPYGDTRPKYWNKIGQSLLWGKNWTFYERSYDTDASQLCPGFNFRRTDPTKQIRIVIGLNRNYIKVDHINNKRRAYGDNIEKFLAPLFREQIICVKKLLNVKFQYYIVDFRTKPEEVDGKLYNDSGVDGLFALITYGPSLRWDHLHPTLYENIVIISRHRGLMTPLEKISNFYGKWTLSSLIAILVLAFTVMWFSTRKLNLAFFNVLRLLINSEIITPMDTWALKLFYIMIFLYFLIIHATFSGHLAEFLTKVQVRPNVDTLEHLKDPGIEKIYNISFKFDSDKKFDGLRNKVQHTRNLDDCLRIESETKSSCIAPITVFHTMLGYRRLIKKNFTNVYYISKNTFGIAFAGYHCKPGFPLRHKFKWAIMFLSELGLMMRHLEINRRAYLKTMARWNLKTNLDYRLVRLSDLYFAFVLLIIGVFIGSLCFLLEIVFEHCYSKSNVNIIEKINVASIDVVPYK